MDDQVGDFEWCGILEGAGQVIIQREAQHGDWPLERAGIERIGGLREAFPIEGLNHYVAIVKQVGGVIEHVRPGNTGQVQHCAETEGQCEQERPQGRPSRNSGLMILNGSCRP